MAAVDVTLVYHHDYIHNTFGGFSLSFNNRQGTNTRVNLKFAFEQLWALAQDATSVAFDFLILAMAVYNTDRAISRSFYSIDGWQRHIRLRVPVVNLEIMNRGLNRFISAFNYLTGDDWDIVFTQVEPYGFIFQLPFINRSDYARVSLFSGGLDSLIGFIDSCSSLTEGKRVLLVSHKELGKEGADQDRIKNACITNNLFRDKYDRVQINAGLNGWEGGPSEGEGTFRARSLLFFGAGIYCAHAIDPQMPLYVPENGTISLNIPLDPGRRSACSTRTTHPVFLKRLQDALSAIGIQNRLYNPYQLKSKADMVVDCCQSEEKARALHILYKESCSCAKRSHKRFWNHRVDNLGQPIRHCGFCLPCIYRQVSLSFAPWNDSEPYGIDIFNPFEMNLSRPNLIRSRDFKALLNFLRNRCSQDTIMSELIASGIIDKDDLNVYSEFLLHSYDQVKDWIRSRGNAQINILGGL